MSTNRVVAREAGRAHCAAQLTRWHGEHHADDHAAALIDGLWRLGWRPHPELLATPPIPPRPRQADPAVQAQAMATIRAALAKETPR